MLSRRMLHVVMLLAVAASLLTAACGVSAAQGKFYLIGMGTAPDLITVRGAEAIKKADIILLEEPSEKEYWKDFIGDKEVWFCPHGSRIYYGVDPDILEDPVARATAIKNDGYRKDTVAKIRRAVEEGKTVASLQGGDVMMYSTTFYIEMLPKDFPVEVIPGIGAFNAATAAVKYSPSFGRDTNSVILTMADFPGRTDTNEKLMATKSSMVFYTMHLDYPALLKQLNKHYPKDTPVAVVSFAGDPEKQEIVRSTVGRFLSEVDYKALPADMHMFLVGKFLTVGQARVDGIAGGKKFIEKMYGKPSAKK
ncbi:MAG: hypothetical protein IT210_21455 [Armatimonadetes bacterium]|nr:hypothetical protein [Armatimonadota bacterium]